MSSLIFVNSHLGQKSPWTKVCLDNCPLDKSLLGQLVPWKIVPWTIVATPNMVKLCPKKAKLCLCERVNEALQFLISYFSTNFSLVNLLRNVLSFLTFRASWSYKKNIQQEREGTSLNNIKVFFNYIEQFSWSFSLYLALSLLISVYFGPSWSISVHLCVSGTIWDPLGLSPTISDYLKLSGTIWDYTGLYGTILDYTP